MSAGANVVDAEDAVPPISEREPLLTSTKPSHYTVVVTTSQDDEIAEVADAA
ncbi:hypothetical protein PISMIDRAFT_682469, partial [Pisolithus microcarpus 441]